MSHSSKQLKDLAQNNPQELIKLIDNSYKTDVKTIAIALDLMGEEVKDESLVLPLIRKLLKHVHVLIRESAVTCAASFYINKPPPQDIIEKMKIMSTSDPSNDLRDLVRNILKDWKYE